MPRFPDDFSYLSRWYRTRNNVVLETAVKCPTLTQRCRKHCRIYWILHDENCYIHRVQTSSTRKKCVKAISSELPFESARCVNFPSSRGNKSRGKWTKGEVWNKRIPAAKFTMQFYTAAALFLSPGGTPQSLLHLSLYHPAKFCQRENIFAPIPLTSLRSVYQVEINGIRKSAILKRCLGRWQPTNSRATVSLLFHYIILRVWDFFSKVPRSYYNAL